LTASTVQTLKPFIEKYLPDLFQLIKTETEFTKIFMIAYQYAVTNTSQLYSMIAGLILPLFNGQMKSENFLQDTADVLTQLSQLVQVAAAMNQP